MRAVRPPARTAQVLQAAFDNLLRRGMLPAGANISLAHTEAYVTALSLPPEQASATPRCPLAADPLPRAAAALGPAAVRAPSAHPAPPMRLAV